MIVAEKKYEGIIVRIEYDISVSNPQYEVDLYDGQISANHLIKSHRFNVLEEAVDWATVALQDIVRHREDIIKKMNTLKEDGWVIRA